MTAMVDQVKAALAVSVFPSVIARGGELAVQGIKDSVVLLAMRGSPGAVLPLLSRIEALLRATVPGVTGVQLVHEDGPAREEMAAIDIAARVRHLLDAELNPTIAAHGGHVELVAVDAGWAQLRFEGGCQGCSLAEVTLRQGIEPLLRARIPDLVGVIDVTDHEAGTTPFFSRAKR